MKTKLFSILIFILTLSACRKELPQLPLGETPVFLVELNNTALNINLQAGISGVVFSEETTTLNSVKYYSGKLQKEDTTFQITFFAGEVFKNLSLFDFENLSTLYPISLNQETLTTIDLTDLNISQFDNASFNINGAGNTTTSDFNTPGIYTIQTNANRNGLAYSNTQTAVVGYENPYMFELKGNINNNGPGVILEGEILNINQSFERIEWTCGNNSQTTTNNLVQFPSSNSANELSAKIFFSDGVVRTRTIGLGIEDAPLIQDIVYLIENNVSPVFTKKFEIVMTLNGISYSSKFVTMFPNGQPYLNISEKSLYTDPVTKQKAHLIKANGLVYLKNEQNNEILEVPLTLQMGLPITF